MDLCHVCALEYRPLMHWSGKPRRTCCSGCKYEGIHSGECTRVQRHRVRSPSPRRRSIKKKRRHDSDGTGSSYGQQAIPKPSATCCVHCSHSLQLLQVGQLLLLRQGGSRAGWLGEVRQLSMSEQRNKTYETGWDTCGVQQIPM